MGKMSSLFRFYFCHLILIKFRTPGQGCQLQHRLQLFRRDQGHHQRDRSLCRQQKHRDRRGDILQQRRELCHQQNLLGLHGKVLLW